MKTKLIILTSAVCFLAACSGNQKPVDLSETKATDANNYEIGSITEKALSSYARLPGQLNPFNEVNLFPKVNGFVKQIYVLLLNRRNLSHSLSLT